ncbi:hypothetical protein D1007_40341 [Hordeum vulgare]|nr:hypothetical protein D1007_40341 [Hordeum vulgare]
MAKKWLVNAREPRRLASNCSTTTEVNGAVITLHIGKAAILHDYFKNLLGTQSTSVINFDLDSLMIGSKLNSSQALSLIRPFSLEEIKLAILSMNVNASPGLDGFGPAFFKVRVSPP